MYNHFLNESKIGIMTLKFDKKWIKNLLLPQNRVQKISSMVIHFADVVVCKILTQISIEFRDHQSPSWFNNSVIIPPIPNDLEKKHP